MILYGSLYPFSFHGGDTLSAALRTLLSTWDRPPQSRGDLLANIGLYVPLGFTLFLAAGNGRVVIPALLSTAIGTLLSFTIELAQHFDAGRVSCLSDVYLNVFGTAVGVVIASLAPARNQSATTVSVETNSMIPMLLILAWVAWRLFPYAPTIDLHKYIRSIRPLLRGEDAVALVFETIRFAILWSGVFYLLPRACNREIPFWQQVALLGAYFIAKILIIGLVITQPEVIGATFALLIVGLFAISKAPRIVAVTFLALVVLERIVPWSWSAEGHPFNWVPFYSFLHGSMTINAQSFLEKFFLYGLAIYLLAEARLALAGAALVLVATLFVTSLLQIHLVGRSADITDALLAVLVSILFSAFGYRNGLFDNFPKRET